MKAAAARPVRFGVNRTYLWILVALGGLFAGVGVVVALQDGLRGGFSAAIALVGLAVAWLPWRLLRKNAAIEVDAAGERVTFLPGGETTEMARVTKINHNRISGNLALSIDDPEWRQRMGLTLGYTMLVHLTLGGYRVNTRFLADRRGFLDAMESMGRARHFAETGEDKPRRRR